MSAPSVAGLNVEARRLRYLRRVNSARRLTAAAYAGRVPTVGREWVDRETGEIRSSVVPPRVARCRWAASGDVSVNHDNGCAAHWSGVEHCASIWACPPCSAKIRHERAEEIQQAADAHVASGGAVVMVTLTVRHRLDDSLARTLGAVLDGWGLLTKGAGWDHWRSRWGVVGYVRAVEVTYGANGWHPHIHALLFVSRGLTDAELGVMAAEVHDSRQGPWAAAPEASWRGLRSRWGWLRAAEAAGGRAPSVEHGVTITRGAVAYVAKVQDLGESIRGLGFEVARSDLKSGRAESLPVFALLDDPGPLWEEYYLGTLGRRCITWSRGLRDLYGVTERTDDEIVEDAQADTVRVVVPADAYRRRVQDSGSIASRALEFCESRDYRAAAVITGGHLATPEERAVRAEAAKQRRERQRAG